MYRIRIENLKKVHRFEELIKVFLNPDEFIIVLDEKDNNGSRNISIAEEDIFIKDNLNGEKYDKCFSYIYRDDNNLLSREIYVDLSTMLDKKSPWGTMTGIRPVRLFRTYLKGITGDEKTSDNDIKSASLRMQEDYLLSSRKLDLVKEIFSFQEESFPYVDDNSLGLYIGIPFCPSRCHYCSFTSNVAKGNDVEEYLNALIREIEFCANELKNTKLYVESVYIGGGTPTSLSANQMDILLESVYKNFDLTKCVEFTVEAGRADTIDEQKLKSIKKYGIERISINPQTLNDSTLVNIGRNHSAKDMIDAFLLAREIGFDVINCDLIAGLPNESLDDYKKSLKKIIELSPENITVHTLSMKRSSKLNQDNKDYQYEKEFDTQNMLEYTYDLMKESGYSPYYMYRQKNMLGLGENVGFAKKGKGSVYNFRIMEENQSILALGAGGISKLYFPMEDRLERVANVSNYTEYIKRIDEMKERKLERFFKEAKDVNKGTKGN